MKTKLQFVEHFLTRPYFNGRVLLSAVLLAGLSAQAQSNFDEEVNAELDRMYSTSRPQEAVPQARPTTIQVNVKNNPQTTQSGAATSSLGQVQKQPTTVIEASPLTESRAERIRRERQETELATEQRIVEKLEQSRIEDEKRRMDQLFGDKLNAAPPVQQAPIAVVPVQEAQVVAAAPIEQEEKKEERPSYFGVSAGVPAYPDVKNIRSNYIASLLFGRPVSNTLLFEVAAQYANYEISQRDGVIYYGVFYPRLTNMDQYQGLIALKGVFMEESIFRPNGGFLLGYSYRTYRDVRAGVNDNVANSQAADLGLTTGFDVDISKKMALGIDIRYLWNLTYQTSEDRVFRPYGAQNSNPIEKLQSYQLMVAGKYYF